MKLAKCIAFQDYKGVKSIIAGLFMTAAASAIAGQSALKPLDWSDTPGMGKNLLAGSSIAAGDHYSAGDFYYWQGKRIPLYRSLTEYAVQFQEELNKETQGAIIEAVSPLAKMTEKGKTRNQAVITLKMEKAEEPAAIEKIIDNLKARSDVRWVAPVYIHVKTGSRMLVTDEIVVKLKPGKDLASLAGLLQSYDLLLVKPMWGTQNEYVLRLQDPKAVNPLEAANALFESGLVEWAQPNFIQEYKRSFTPNDPRLSRQWHLTGTDNGIPTPGHVRALKAWDITLGTPDITIAVIDDGVQMDHPDLAENIFTNPGEIPGNGVDDDGNGFIDDVHGWDFVNNDNDPSPFIGLDDPPDGDVHGTAAAGVAAARGDNGKGGSGVCPRCTILPVKIFNGNDSIDDAGIASAIRYAANLADVVNNSWSSRGGESSVIQSALQDAITQGRGGRGAVVLFASGNSASGLMPRRILSIPAGTYRFEWVYSKDISDVGAVGRDTVWLAWARFPGGELVNFESGSLPAGWLPSGAAPWTIVKNAKHADEGLCFTHAAKAGPITHNQFTAISVVKTVPAGDLVYYAEVSSEAGFDGLTLKIDMDNDGSFDFSSRLQSGIPEVRRPVDYPGRYTQALAIGASSDQDCRSSYSQFGPELDFVAPSSGGPLNREIFTTDLTGANGYNPNGNYTATFSGTSSATPLAAGIVGLVLSRNPNLTRKDVKQILRNTADKIGPAVYDEKGRNDRYGFGKLNANKAVKAARE